MTHGKQHQPTKLRLALIVVRKFISLLRITALVVGLPRSIFLLRDCFQLLLSLIA